MVPKKLLEDKEKLNLKYGELNKKSLTQLSTQQHRVQMSDGSYKVLKWSQMTDAQQARVIDRTMTQNAEIAKVYMWTQVSGKKYYTGRFILVSSKRTRDYSECL